MKNLLVIGAACADVMLWLDHLPITGEDINLQAQDIAMGGCGYNAAMCAFANGIDVSALLTKNETTAMLNKMLPMEEIAMANKGFGNKVRAIATGNQLVASEEAAVAAIVARASDKNAKAFTPEQYKLLNEFVSAEDNAADRKVMFDDLMSKASEKLEGINPKWIEDVQHELDDLAEGAEREQGRQQSMGR